jgi:altronate hydrolase
METLKRNPYLQIHESDTLAVALRDLESGLEIEGMGAGFPLKEKIPAKHKFALKDFGTGDSLTMYGVLVGIATQPIPKGALIHTHNTKHASSEFHLGERNIHWKKPNVQDFDTRTFMGYHREDGSVGTANYWLVIPMVFCENRNISVLQEAFMKKLGYKKGNSYEIEVENMISLYQSGKSPEEILHSDWNENRDKKDSAKIFPNIDGIKFLHHSLGCGGTKTDSDALCGLLAGYITHPNVAGATVLSLGCQHAQLSILEKEIQLRDPNFSKPLYLFEQQKLGTEAHLMKTALKQTFLGLIQANQNQRKPAPLSKLCIGLECGGSDGFSGISANPALGYVSDMLVAMGGSVILSEFPELCGVEQELSNRCIEDSVAQRFMDLMILYNQRAEQDGSGFYANPSPGNIRDGLITDAMKSAGAAKKGGTSPITAVLDYPEKVKNPGLHLLCTPGSDVESTTAEVGAGANIVLFTTGLGTPTGNPITPVIKLSTNTRLFHHMPDIIDIDCGGIIEGKETLPELASRILNYIIQVASGEQETKASALGQDDFIPWKRGVSL